MKQRKRSKMTSAESLTSRKAPSFKQLECSKGCGRSEKVDVGVEQVICWHCTAQRTAPPEMRAPAQKVDPSTKKPKGWHFMKEYVDPQGNVFQEGVEKPELKGTLTPTPLKPKKTRAQKDADEEKKAARLVKLYKKKQELLKKEQQNASTSTSGVV